MSILFPGHQLSYLRLSPLQHTLLVGTVPGLVRSSARNCLERLNPVRDTWADIRNLRPDS